MFRRAKDTEVNAIMGIISEAQAYFKAQGIPQWQDNYPNTEVILRDIENNNSYVLIKEDKIVATVALIFSGEKTYEKIYEGQWLTSGEFAALHRIAVEEAYKGRGLSSEIIKYAEELCLAKGIYSIRVDTHKDNLSMQKLLRKNKFQYCGIIYLENGSERIAFEKIL